MFRIEMRNLKLEIPNEEWIGHNGFEVNLSYNRIEEWRVIEILSWFSQYGQNFFSDLPIWNIDWQQLELQLKTSSVIIKIPKIS